jgi:hypothetical protein
MVSSRDKVTRPTWLAQAHQTLDRAAWAAYAWPDDSAETDDETILRRLLALNLKRAGEESAPTTLA